MVSLIRTILKLYFQMSNAVALFAGLPIFTKVPPSLATPAKHFTLRVDCEAEGFPPPMLNWTRLGMPLPAGKTEIKDDALTIKGLSPSDSGGLYECVATNSMGTKKVTMNLVVQRTGLSGLAYFNNCPKYFTL